MLRRMGIIAVLSLIVAALAAVPALANPVVTTEPSVDASGNLPVSFTENLPADVVGQQVGYTLVGTADAEYICLNSRGVGDDCGDGGDGRSLLPKSG